MEGATVRYRWWKGALVALAALVLALGMAACGDDDDDDGGSSGSSTSSTEVIDKALTSGQIDGYPEYTGTILSVVAAEKRRPTSQEDAYDAAKAFNEKRGFTLLNPT